MLGVSHFYYKILIYRNDHSISRGITATTDLRTKVRINNQQIHAYDLKASISPNNSFYKLLLCSFLISIVKSKLNIVFFDWKCSYLLAFIQKKGKGNNYFLTHYN